MKEAILVSVALVLVLCFVTVRGQERRQVRQQTSFGSEEDFIRPVKLPSAVIASLKLVDGGELERCQSNEKYPTLRRPRLSDHFTASLLNVRNKTGGLQMIVVRSNSSCFNGVHAARFWLFAKKKGAGVSGYKVIFETVADGLGVATRATQIFPDIETFSHTARKGFSTEFKYRRAGYRRTACFSEDLGSEVARRRIKCI